MAVKPQHFVREFTLARCSKGAWLGFVCISLTVSGEWRSWVGRPCPNYLLVCHYALILVRA